MYLFFLTFIPVSAVQKTYFSAVPHGLVNH